MNSEQTGLVMAAGGAAALLLLVACALLWRTSRRLAARVEQLESERTRLPETAAPTVAPAAAPPAAYVITDATGLEPAPPVEGVVPGRIDGALFADIVARESVVRAVGLAHGLRRALSAQSRNRIRFEMRQEVKRSRKQRRADLKAAMRDVRARERAHLPDGEDAA